MKKLNIGCGRDYKEGWINTDISHACRADAYFDIRKDPIIQAGDIRSKAMPVEDESIDEVYISGVLEQIGENEHLIHAMNECHRVLKPGGVMTVVVPNARYAIAHQDPMDIRKFTPETFQYFLKGARQYLMYGEVYGFEAWSTIKICTTITVIKIKPCKPSQLS
jgi:SAM-dependent methyltransferase